MGRIPLPPTGNPQLDYALRLIDEQLSELYSQHGTQTPRTEINAGAVKLRTDLGEFGSLQRGFLYRDLLPIGLAIVNSAGELSFTRNIRTLGSSDTTSRFTTGSYRYGLSSGQTTNILPIASITDTGFMIQTTVPSDSRFQVFTYDSAAALTDAGHRIVVFGELP